MNDTVPSTPPPPLATHTRARQSQGLCISCTATKRARKCSLFVTTQNSFNYTHGYGQIRSLSPGLFLHSKKAPLTTPLPFVTSSPAPSPRSMSSLARATTFFSPETGKVRHRSLSTMKGPIVRMAKVATTDDIVCAQVPDNSAIASDTTGSDLEVDETGTSTTPVTTNFTGVDGSVSQQNRHQDDNKFQGVDLVDWIASFVTVPEFLLRQKSKRYTSAKSCSQATRKLFKDIQKSALEYSNARREFSQAYLDIYRVNRGQVDRVRDMCTNTPEESIAWRFDPVSQACNLMTAMADSQKIIYETAKKANEARSIMISKFHDLSENMRQMVFQQNKVNDDMPKLDISCWNDLIQLCLVHTPAALGDPEIDFHFVVTLCLLGLFRSNFSSVKGVPGMIVEPSGRNKSISPPTRGDLCKCIPYISSISTPCKFGPNIKCFYECVIDSNPDTKATTRPVYTTGWNTQQLLVRTGFERGRLYFIPFFFSEWIKVECTGDPYKRYPASAVEASVIISEIGASWIPMLDQMPKWLPRMSSFQAVELATTVFANGFREIMCDHPDKSDVITKAALSIHGWVTENRHMFDMVKWGIQNALNSTTFYRATRGVPIRLFSERDWTVFFPSAWK